MTLTYVEIVVASVAVLITAGVLIFKIGSWYNGLKTDRANFKDFMKKINDKMEKINDQIKTILIRLPSLSTTSASPVQLTKLGKDISVKLGAKDWAENAAQNFIDKTQGMNPFEIQTLAFEHVKSFKADPTLLRKMQDCAFQSGVDMEGVRDVLAIELRDCLLRMKNMSPMQDLDEAG